MGFIFNNNVLNQKGSPAIYTDTFANRPAFGYAGRLFISNDTAAIYEDTGTAWVLIANVSSGAGTLQQVTTNGNTSNVGISVTAGGVSTNSATITSLTQGSVPFVGTAGLITQDNTNLFFDDTNNRLGINTNTPSNNLDVHSSGTTPIIAINNTAGNQSLIAFAKNSTAKWRIGNSSTDNFDVLNVPLALTAISVNGTTNTSYFNQNIAIKQYALYYNTAGYNSIGCDINGFYFQRDTNLNNAYFDFSLLLSTRNFTFPNATGTIALTTDLGAYLPLTGGTLSGTLNGTNVTFNSVNDFLNNTGVSTTTKFIRIGNTSADMAIGVEGSTPTQIIAGSGGIAYSTILKTVSTTSLILGTNSIAALTISGTTQDATFKGNLNINNASKLSIYRSDNARAIEIYTDNTACNVDAWVATSEPLKLSSNGTSGRIVLHTNGAEQMRVASTGIITVTNLAGTGSRAVIADSSGNLSAPVSDETVKENVQILKYGLNAIMQLNPISFEYIDEYKNYGEGLQIGNIAQDVAKVIPEAVFTTPSTGLMGINYNQFDGIYIKAIQELNERIELLLSRIEYLENK
jgi:hypothetical protein